MNKELYVACINVARDVVEHLEAIAESHCYEQPHLSNADNDKVSIVQRHANNQNSINANTKEPIVNASNKECDAPKEQDTLGKCCQKNNFTRTQEVELMRLNAMKELVQHLFLCTYSWAQKRFTSLEQATEDYCLVRVNELTSIVLEQEQEWEEEKLRQLLTQGRKENVSNDNDSSSLSTASPSQKIITRRRSLKCPAIAEVLKRVELLLYLSTADQIERFADNENSALRTQLQMAQQANTSFLNLIHSSCNNVKCLQVHEQSPSLLFRRLFRQEKKLQEQEQKYAECSKIIDGSDASVNNKFTETSKQNEKCASEKEASNILSDVPPHVIDDSDDAASSTSYAFEAIVDNDDDGNDNDIDIDNTNQITDKECNNTITEECRENERKATEKTAPIPSLHKNTNTMEDSIKEREESKQELSNAIKTGQVQSVLEESKQNMEKKLNESGMCSNVIKPNISNFMEEKANIWQHFKNNNKEVRLKEIAKMQNLLQLLIKYGKVDYNICDFTFDKYMVRCCSKNETEYCLRVYASVLVHGNEQCQASNPENSNNDNNDNNKVCSIFLHMTSYYNNLPQARKMAMLEVAWKLMPEELVAFAFESTASVDNEINNFVDCKLQSCSPHTPLRAESVLREKLAKLSLLKESELTAHQGEDKEYMEDINSKSKHEARMPKIFEIEKFSKVCFVKQTLRLLTMCKELEQSKENDVHLRGESNLEAMNVLSSECESKDNTHIPLTFAWSVEELRSNSANITNENNYDNTDCLEYHITIIHIPTNEVYGSSTNNRRNNSNSNKFTENKEVNLPTNNVNKQYNNNNNANHCPRKSGSFFCALMEALVNAARRCNALELFHKLCDELFSTPPPPVGTIYEAALFYLKLAFNLQVSKKCNTPLESLVDEAILHTENNVASGAVVMEYTNESRDIFATLEIQLTQSQQFISEPFYNVRLSTGRGNNRIVARETCAKKFCVKNLYTIFANTLKDLPERKEDESKEVINKICENTSQKLKIYDTKKKMTQVGLSKAIIDCKTKSIDDTWYETMWNDV